MQGGADRLPIPREIDALKFPADPLETEKRLLFLITEPNVEMALLGPKYFDIHWYADTDSLDHLDPSIMDAKRDELNHRTVALMDHANYRPGEENQPLSTDDRLRVRLCFWLEHLDRYRVYLDKLREQSPA